MNDRSLKKMKSFYKREVNTVVLFPFPTFGVLSTVACDAMKWRCMGHSLGDHNTFYD